MKKLEELTIVDDFMFGAVMSNPKLCKQLLELILNVKIKSIKYPELQKSIANRYQSKSVRLDVYVEDNKNTVYNTPSVQLNRLMLDRRAVKTTYRNLSVLLFRTGL